jgi:hypothetical protein
MRTFGPAPGFEVLRPVASASRSPCHPEFDNSHNLSACCHLDRKMAPFLQSNVALGLLGHDMPSVVSVIIQKIGANIR